MAENGMPDFVHGAQVCSHVDDRLNVDQSNLRKRFDEAIRNYFEGNVVVDAKLLDVRRECGRIHLSSEENAHTARKITVSAGGISISSGVLKNT